jgi:hypothetical protein
MALSADGSSALIGARGNNNGTGAGYAFTSSGSNWVQQAEFTASDGEGGDFFGSGVALSANGNTALIGAPGHNNSAGAAYIFSVPGSTFTGTSTPTTTPLLPTQTATNTPVPPTGTATAIHPGNQHGNRFIDGHASQHLYGCRDNYSHQHDDTRAGRRGLSAGKYLDLDANQHRHHNRNGHCHRHGNANEHEHLGGLRAALTGPDNPASAYHP